MMIDRMGAIASSFQRLYDGGTVAGLSERQLLDRFLAHDDADAFEAIVARHGPMVLGVCRRWLDDPNDADDAFQATFLVLVRRAHSLRQRELLANWLHGVALRVARRARRRALDRRTRESSIAASRDRTADPGDFGIELQDELAGLPRDYRLPLILCYLEGRTHEEAAQALGWPIGTVKGRLARARSLLRDRLVRRGLAPASCLVVTSLERTPQAVPSPLLAATVRAAVSGTAAGAAVTSATVTNLVRETLQAMWISKILAIGSAGALAVAITAGGAVLAHQQAGPPGAGDDPTASRAAQGSTSRPTPRPSVESTLPSQSIAQAPKPSPSTAPSPPGESATTPPTTVLVGPFADRSLPNKLTSMPLDDLEETRLRIGRRWHYRGLDDIPQTRKTLQILDKSYKFPFDTDTPLGEVLAYIKDITKSESEESVGIQIYLDEVGIRRMSPDVSEASTVRLALDGVSIRTALRLLLRQLDLAYVVREGVVIISSPEGLLEEVEGAEFDRELRPPAGN